MIITFLLSLPGCSDSYNNEPAVIAERDSSSTPDITLPEDMTAEKAPKPDTCVFVNPDTSLSQINLRDPQSTKAILKTELSGDTTFKFQSNDKKQVLGVTVHAGDGYDVISIFQVKYATNAQGNAKPAGIQHFATEKGIKLGLKRENVVALLGDCYTTTDSTGNEITIHYRLEDPQDSKTRLLERHNMPVYYADYFFRNNKLVAFEFGFEYP